MVEKRAKTNIKTIFRNLFLKKKGDIIKEEMAELHYEQTNVKEILTWMRDMAEYIVDLAYSAIILNSSEMAQEVLEIESKMDTMLYKIRIYTLFAAPGNFEEAEQLSGLLHFANAVESISDAATDIVDLFFSDIKSKPIFAFVLQEADEKIRAIHVKAGSDLVGHRIGDLMIESSTGVRVLAIRRDNKWLYDIGAKTRIRDGDYLIAKGVEEGLKELEAVADGRVKWGKYKSKESNKPRVGGESEGIEMLLKLKNTSELMVDLAISSVMYNNKEIAEEVYILEEHISETYNDMLRFIAAKVAPSDPDFAVVLIKLINGMEAIADAAKNIANIVLRDIEPHPIIGESIKESNVVILRVKVHKGSKLDGKRLGKVKLASETGMWAFAIKRGDQWIFGPNEATRILEGDMIFARGPQESTGLLMEWAGEKAQ